MVGMSPLPVWAWRTVAAESVIVAFHVTGSEYRATRFRLSESPSKLGVRVVAPSTDQRAGGVVSGAAPVVGTAAPATTWSVVRSRSPTIEAWKPVVAVSGSMTAV